jgi:Transposase DDE domain
MQKKRTSRETNWQTLVSFFPSDWEHLATETRANVRLRGFRSVDAVMRTLLLHVARGYSLRETVVRARMARLAKVSDVALLKRLRSAEEWFRTLCVALLQEQGIEMPQAPPQLRLRLVDSTTIKEPGKTGSLWRVHYSFRVPEVRCDAFTLTPTKGVGMGDSLTQFTVAPGDHLIADRGYCHANGIEHVVSHGGAILVRLNTAALPLFTPQGRRVPLLRRLAILRRAGQIGEWSISVQGATRVIAGRVCAIRKTEEAIKRAEKQLRRNASKSGEVLQPATLEYAKYIIVFTTFAPLTFSAAVVLHWYRVRWQVELAFKRLKSLAQLGHLPKADAQSARAWLYGKLFVALLTEQLIRRGQALSPCTPARDASLSANPLARICVRVAPDSARYRTGTLLTLRPCCVASHLPGLNRASAPAQNAGVRVLVFLIAIFKWMRPDSHNVQPTPECHAW